MKKYITLAALLAAGTAFANAETISLSATGYAALGGAEANKKVTAYDFDYTGVGAIVLKSGWTGFDEETLGLTGAPDLSGYLTAQWSYGDSTTSVLFSNLKTSFENESDSKISLIRFDTGHTSYSYFQLCLVSDDNGGARLSFEVQDRGTWYSDSISLTNDSMKVTVDINLPNITGSTNDAVRADANFSILVNDVVVTNLSEIAFNPGINGDVKQLTLGDTGVMIGVPEPSAFGLLAGVGALALVASRRRRR